MQRLPIITKKKRAKEKQPTTLYARYGTSWSMTCVLANRQNMGRLLLPVIAGVLCQLIRKQAVVEYHHQITTNPYYPVRLNWKPKSTSGAIY